ncbi:toll/interleukin-1 receptor domain-containing protein [Streptomyces sp. NPDC091209]|uniref:toll/interleukin-1 receptor domain-containing protein n=1 Tax=Streptomyces sp. NPDC091209 TaxID=3365974 RepID=UPI0038178C4D
MADDFVTSYAAEENPTYAARFHQDLVAAVARQKGRAIEAAMCCGGQGVANHPLIAQAQVLVALCSTAYYADPGCGGDWAVFDHRLSLVPVQFRPAVPPARVLVRWQPVTPPRGIPLAPIMSGEVTDSYACKGVYGILREEGFSSAAYRDALGEIAGTVCAGQAGSPPVLAVGELPRLVLPFPRGGHGPRAKVPAPRAQQEVPHRPRVFLSYAHEEDGGVHQKRVNSLYQRLHAEEIDADMDTAAHERAPQHWARWMRKHYTEADFVVVVASPGYKRRAEHEEVRGEGDGVGFEADYILEERTRDRRWYRRILLVSFPEHGRECVPDFLTGVTLYTLDPETGEGDLGQLVRYIKNEVS